MTIEELLKNKELDVRLTSGTKWLVWYLEQWAVFDRPYGKKINRCAYSGDNLEEALNVFRGE